MAKKKTTKSKSRKKAEPEYIERSPFVDAAGGVLLVILALLLLIGGFGTGGDLPISLFSGVYWAFGYAAYLVAFSVAFWAAAKFLTPDKRYPASRLSANAFYLLAAATWFQIIFVSKNDAGSWVGGHGGSFGSTLAGVTLGALDKIPASLIFFILALSLGLYAFGVTLEQVLKLKDLFKRQPSEDNEDLAALQKKAAQEPGFKLNEGVPVEHHAAEERPLPRRSTLRNSAEKLSAAEVNQAALTTASDPDWKLPSTDLLNQKQDKADAGNVNEIAKTIHDTLSNFKINVEMEGANIGPRVTQYTLKPPTGVKLEKITALDNNLALDLAAESIRIEAPIPGKRAVGIEVPNVKPATVRVSSILQSKEWAAESSPLSFAIGKDIAGKPIMGDLAEMPHLLVAGQTGAGKSVMINTLLTSLLYRNSPSDLKLILVDPKQVEMAPYHDIPHLLTPVINEPEKCISALKWAVAEMERRLKAMAEVHKRNIGEYNKLKKEEGMPYIVIVIDELADLMMMAARDVEALIARIAQKARAAGIHLVLATQRPSVNVITGLIKANVPARIAFTTTSQVDSRTILDQMGAEKLLGRGDMLITTKEMPKPKRVQAALIEDGETMKVLDFIREQRQAEYDDEVVSQPVQFNGKGGIVADYGGQDPDDNMFKDAVRAVIEQRKASTSLLQRKLRIGYGRAARIIEQMEEQGIIAQANGSKPRDVLVNSMDEVFGSTGAAGADSLDDMAEFDPNENPRDNYLNQ